MKIDDKTYNEFKLAISRLRLCGTITRNEANELKNRILRQWGGEWTIDKARACLYTGTAPTPEIERQEIEAFGGKSK